MHFSGNSVTYLSLLIKWPLKRNAMLKSFFSHIFDKWTFIRCKTSRNINNLFVFCPSKTHYKNKHFWSKYRENGSQCLLKRKIVHLCDFLWKKRQCAPEIWLQISEKFKRNNFFRKLSINWCNRQCSNIKTCALRYFWNFKKYDFYRVITLNWQFY